MVLISAAGLAGRREGDGSSNSSGGGGSSPAL